METSQSRNSDKLNIIDFSTYTQIQQHSNLTPYSATRNIRNSKYKRSHQNAENDFDLLALIAASNIKKAQKQRAHFKKGATLIKPTRITKKNGKTRESRKKKRTRLKKSILKNRELKHSRARPSEYEGDKQEIPESNFKQSLHSDDSVNVCCEELEDSMQPTISNARVSQSIVSANLYQVQTDSTRKIDYINPNVANAKLGAVTNQIGAMSLQDAVVSPLKAIHSRKFRAYCDNFTTSELAQLCRELLSDLNRFQRRAFQKNPIKANAHRRIVLGFREVQNNLRINKIKLVLIATDCEQCGVEGGIDDTIESIKTECKSLEVPYAFPLQRRQLAYALKKNGNISCVGILDYDGVRDKFSQLLLELENARANYATTMERLNNNV